MVLDAFRLEGKVAIVTGCDTGLGQGMALALAEAGCDVVGVNRKIPYDTEEKITAVGRHFMAIQADLSQQEALSGIVTQTVAAFGRVDILVNNAGTIRRQDALDFSEKDWDDVMNLNLKSVFSCHRQWRASFWFRATAEKSLTLPQCSLFRAGSAFLPTPHQKVACLESPAYWLMSGRLRELMSMPSHPVIWRPIIPSSCAKTVRVISKLSIAFPQGAGEHRMTCKARSFFSPARLLTISTVTRLPWTEVGWRVNRAFVTKGYNVTSSAYCIKPLYCMN